MAEGTRPAVDKLSVQQDVEAPPEAVWACLLQPGEWWHEEIEFDARPGGVFVEPWTDAQGRKHVTNGAVIAFHPPFGMVLSWADEDWMFDTIVAIRIEAKPVGATRILLDHEGWSNAPRLQRKTLVAEHRAGWTHHLQSLARFAETRKTERNRGNVH